jgi:hypothetical protein
VDRITVTPVGTKGMQARVNGMAGSVQGAVMRPIVADAAGQLRGLAYSLAPHRTGKGRQGIISDLMKIGKGYCYYWVRLSPDAYYMKFQEWGLGTGATRPVQAKTARRRGNYLVSMAIRKALLEGHVTPNDLEQAYRNMKNKGMELPWGLSKRQLRRQRILARGGYLQGARQPNMPAHPFLRPSVKFARVTLSRYMLEGIAANVLRWTSPQ